MIITYTVTPDYNLKCYRIFVKDDGIYWRDLGPVDGEERARGMEILGRLGAYAMAYHPGVNVQWRRE